MVMGVKSCDALGGMLAEQHSMVQEDAAANSERAADERAQVQLARDVLWPSIHRDLASSVRREAILVAKQKAFNSAGPITARFCDALVVTSTLSVLHSFCHAVKPA